MATVKLSQALRDEYENLFNACIIQPNRKTDGVKSLVLKNKDCYGIHATWLVL